MNSISFSKTLSNTLDMVSEWPKKRSYEPSIPTNLLFFTIETNISSRFYCVRITIYLQTGHFYPPTRTHIIYNEKPNAGKWAADCPKCGDTTERGRQARCIGRCSALRGRMQHAAMTDAAHCDNEATIVPPKVDGAAFPKGGDWRTEGRKPNLSGQKTSS